MSVKISDLSPSESNDSSMEDEIDILLKVTENVWVQCENLNCLKWRKVPKDHAGHFDKETSWFCLMNPDFNYNECWKPEENHSKYEKIAAKAGIKFILSQLENGELVWAKTAGYCRWPAVISKDPDSGLYITLDVDGDPYAYHVEFLGNPHSHCWVPVHNVEIYGHQYRNSKDKTSLKPSVNCSAKGKKKGKHSKGMTFSDKNKRACSQYKIGDAIEEAESLLTMSKGCRLQLMVYEYETRIFEHSDMQILEKSRTGQNKSSYPASNPQQNMYAGKKRATNTVETSELQCFDQTVPDVSMATSFVFNRNRLQVNEPDPVKVFVPYCQVTESCESVRQARKHSKLQVTEQRKSVKQLKPKKTKRCREKSSIKKQQTSSHSGLPDWVGNRSAEINSVNIQSAEDFLYCSEDFSSIMKEIETNDGNENPIDTDPLLKRDDFDSMMKEIEDDIECSSQLEQELLDTDLNQDFHNELTNSDGMEYLTYFSPPLLDKGNEASPKPEAGDYLLDDIESHLELMEGYFDDG